MTVYVDDMDRPYKPAHRTGRTYVMSHMIADTEEELHAMAKLIGVARHWFQGDHYDICKSKKVLAIENGAVLITMREIAKIRMAQRRVTRTNTGGDAAYHKGHQ